MAESEIERITPTPRRVVLSSGQVVELVRLQTRQLFALLKILTHGGMGAGILNALDFSLPADEFVQRLVTMLLLSIPDAAQEALEFIALMVQPAGLIRAAKLSKDQREANQRMWDEMNSALVNPDPGDTIDVIVAIIEQEAPEFQALGKKLASALSLFARTGQDKEPAQPQPDGQALAEMAGVPVSPASPSAEPSPPLSTSSPASTDGPISES
jgi:hypothetical protein